jgi:hypothetical protein
MSPALHIPPPRPLAVFEGEPTEPAVVVRLPSDWPRDVVLVPTRDAPYGLAVCLEQGGRWSLFHLTEIGPLPAETDLQLHDLKRE